MANGSHAGKLVLSSSLIVTLAGVVHQVEERIARLAPWRTLVNFEIVSSDPFLPEISNFLPLDIIDIFGCLLELFPLILDLFL